jgi:hypothetical protein
VTLDEQTLRAKLTRIEALFARAGTEGERDAAASARLRIVERLRRIERDAPPTEHRFSVPDPWARRLLLALLRRYELSPYRYPGQKRQTVMVRAPKPFVDETLWPEFQSLSDELHRYLEDVATRVVSELLHRDASDAPEVTAPAGMPQNLR